jgi:hypothetical protein
MCDYSLQHVSSRPAKVGDKLTTRNFRTGTLGFAAPENLRMAVCVLPGTELAFSKEVGIPTVGIFWSKLRRINRHKTAIFRQINKHEPCSHHDALEFPDGHIVLLTKLAAGQEATVLQLPAQPTTEMEVEAQKRVEYIGWV